MKLYTKNYVWFDKNLPFTPERKELIYLETEYNQHLDKFFKQFRLPKYCDCDGWVISYLPKISESISTEHLKYMFPYLSGISVEDCRQRLTYENIFSHLLPESIGIIRQGFIEYDSTYEKGHRFEYIEIQPSDYKKLSRDLFNYIVDNRVLGSTIPGIGEYRADDGYADRFFYTTERLSEEIRTRVHRLRMLGVSETAIRALLDEPIVISRMVITKDFRILLPDYDMEIKMTPLVKSVYFLFLMHPEGIQLFQLRSYRDELLEIYKSMTGRSDYEAIVKSIEDVTDPTQNSINEKCSRIREAFYKEFRGDIAEFYCISGEHYSYGPKKIELDRAKVEFEDKAFLQDLQKCRTEVKHTTFVPEASTDGFLSNNYSIIKNKC